MNKMQNQISDGQSKDRENQDKYLGPPQQAQKGYDPVPDPAGTWISETLEKVSVSTTFA